MIDMKYLLMALLTLSLQSIQAQSIKNLNVLDSNKDGVLSPYEALDVLLSLQEELGKQMSIADLDEALRNLDAEEEGAFFEEFKAADKNQNGKVEFKEVDKETREFLALMDTNGDEAVTEEEMRGFSFEKAFFLTDQEIDEQVEGLFAEYGQSGKILLNKLRKRERKELADFDIDANEEITKEEAKLFLTANSSEAQFRVEGTVAYMNGTICTSTPARVLKLLFTHPEVKMIEMQIVPGSINDEANLRAALYVHQFGLNTRVTRNSLIASGGTDFFLAGIKREVEDGATIGVHSWGGGTTAATDYPKEHEVHQKYLEFYRSVNIPESFYWFTLEAAPASGIHDMTPEEIEKYKVRN